MKIFAYIWPLGLVVLSNIVYNIAAKSTPAQMNPLASLVVTYLVGAAVSAILYFLLPGGGEKKNFIVELSKLNWAPFVLGIVIVGLEVGYIYAYRAGWQVSTAAIVQSVFLAIALLFVGWLLYHEDMSIRKLLGLGICLAGLYFLNT